MIIRTMQKVIDYIWKRRQPKEEENDPAIRLPFLFSSHFSSVMIIQARKEAEAAMMISLKEMQEEQKNKQMTESANKRNGIH